MNFGFSFQIQWHLLFLSANRVREKKIRVAFVELRLEEFEIRGPHQVRKGKKPINQHGQYNDEN